MLDGCDRDMADIGDAGAYTAGWDRTAGASASSLNATPAAGFTLTPSGEDIP